MLSLNSPNKYSVEFLIPVNATGKMHMLNPLAYLISWEGFRSDQLFSFLFTNSLIYFYD